ncbi:tryptophan synthase beta subunit-like PLP-dependent enzyme [Mycena capillaripes]|nr:tryptophan synthase beta subunit-like PLP-dependent enzyme [Mycena capillaripes]
MASSLCRPVLHNNFVHHPAHTPIPSSTAIQAFHASLPKYVPTPLVALPQALAEKIGVKSVLVKAETDRLGLPSFKILGAAWGVVAALAQRYGFVADDPAAPISLELLREKEAEWSAKTGLKTTLVAATDGNHGRAVARIATWLGLGSRIFVPRGLHQETVLAIAGELAEVVHVNGSYDEAVSEAAAAASSEGAVFVQDTTLAGYELIPQRIVEGYMTMLHEIDTQLHSTQADLVVTPVGVGSLASAVVTHYKAANSSRRPKTAILTVEPDTAACLYTSLAAGVPTAHQTGHRTIMAGLDCATLSPSAWPLLQAGVDASVTVSDYEAHLAVQTLQGHGVPAGPCGGAALAALLRLTPSDKEKLGLSLDSTVVLLCTEGARTYSVPRPVDQDDAVSLTQALVQIDSTNPSLSVGGGRGEIEIAQFITAWLEHRDITTHWLEKTPSRPSVVGIARGVPGPDGKAGKSLMLNGHSDTVSTTTYAGNPLSGHIEGGKLYGRGAADMKSGLAACMIAIGRSCAVRLPGTVILAAVADEEDASLGTEEVIAAGFRADAAIVCEPTNEDLVIGHKGFIHARLAVHGRAAHGSRFDLGVDAIARMGYILVELDKYARGLLEGKGAGGRHPLFGTGSTHMGTISGGTEPSTYPASCLVSIERRTVPGETEDSVANEIKEAVHRAVQAVPDLDWDLEMGLTRPPFSISEDHDLIQLVQREIHTVKGQAAQIRGEAFWTDCALLANAGIPAVMYGAVGDGLHADTEWTDIASVERLAETLSGVCSKFCS